MEENSDYKSEYSESERFQEMVFGKKKVGLPLTPYFVYEIKVKHHPFHLCFPKEPIKRRYENDIFNMLADLPSVGEAVKCLKYHLEQYASREDFLEFFRYELAARIQKSKSSERLIIYTQCLEWVKEQLSTGQSEQLYAIGETKIETNQKEKLMALLKFMLREMDSSKSLDYGFYASHSAIAAILSHFSSFEKYMSSTLTKKVNNCQSDDYVPEELKETLRRYFK